MSKIHDNPIRVGNFTSSKISKLMGAPKPMKTYIEEKNMERQLDLPLTVETTSHPFSWGKACELRIFDILGTEYERISQETIQHPTMEYWAGSPDGKKHADGKTIAVQFKCPFTRKSYMQFYNSTDIQAVRENHTDGEDYYWQCISDAILLGTDIAELVVYMPYRSELTEIRELCSTSEQIPVNEMYQFMWIVNSNDEELPYLKDGGKVKNKKVFLFDIPPADKEFMKKRIIEAGTQLIAR